MHVRLFSIDKVFETRWSARNPSETQKSKVSAAQVRPGSVKVCQ